MKPHRLGELSVETVVENACVAMPFADFLPGIDAQMLAAEKAWLVPRFADAALQNGILSFHSYLLRTPEHNILIDTCMGNDKERGGHAAFHQLRTPWLQNLAAAGLAPEQIDYVMCTHMHADHIGWNTRLSEGRWVPRSRTRVTFSHGASTISRSRQRRAIHPAIS
ncbi:MAG: MBL fold metallo-hydrolase [Proteobacteria bacterium]|nr:MBL fold metallo-hydrolase [Pseudomonadota bacterium]